MKQKEILFMRQDIWGINKQSFFRSLWRETTSRPPNLRTLGYCDGISSAGNSLCSSPRKPTGAPLWFSLLPLSAIYLVSLCFGEVGRRQMSHCWKPSLTSGQDGFISGQSFHATEGCPSLGDIAHCNDIHKTGSRTLAPKHLHSQDLVQMFIKKSRSWP